MYATDHVPGVAPMERAAVLAFPKPRNDDTAPIQSRLSLAQRVRRSVGLAQRHLTDLQRDQDHWGAIRSSRGALARPDHRQVGDTAWSIVALSASGLRGDDPCRTAAIGWLVQQCAASDHRDWPLRMDELPGVLLALGQGSLSNHEAFTAPPPYLRFVGESPQLDDDRREENAAALTREMLLERLLADQHADGGWGPRGQSTAATTGLALEAIVVADIHSRSREVRRAVNFLRGRQSHRGCWTDPVGGPTDYATWLALSGLAAAGVSTSDPAMIRAAAWFLTGGVMDRAVGSRRHAQTLGPVHDAWVILGLVAAGKSRELCVIDQIESLVDAQCADGGWIERRGVATRRDWRAAGEFDPAGVYFPLLALSRWSVSGDSDGAGGGHFYALREELIPSHQRRFPRWSPHASRAA